MSQGIRVSKHSRQRKPIRVALGQVTRPDEDLLVFARQLGLTSIQFNTPELPGDRRWELEDLIRLRKQCEAHGVTVEAIENLPNSFYERAMFGLPGRDEDIQNVIDTTHNIGKAGIPILGYHFMPASVWRTSLAPSGRGGAVISGFDMDDALDPERQNQVLIARRDRRPDVKDSWVRGAFFELPQGLDDQAMWANYKYFLEAVLPAAEEAGVRLAIHPDDPPVPSLGGVARLFRDVAALKQASNLVPSPAWAVELCLGTVSEMGGEQAVFEAIEYFGQRNQIAYVHMRDVRGVVPHFEECFLGEGNYRPGRVIQALMDVGFDGFIIDDHVPEVVGDTPYNHRGRAYTIGYIQGLLEAVASLR